MKQEIKERIEKIRKGEVPEGYRKTKVGIIPGEWEVKKLTEIADIKTGPFGSALHEKDYVKDGTPIITVEHLGEQGVVHDNLPMVSDFDKNRLKSYVLKIGDIVFSRVGSVDRNSLIRETENGWLFSGRLLRIRVTTANISPSYLSYHFHQEITKQRIRSVAVGQTMASLNTQILKDILVSFPPTRAEQQKIVEILIIWDKAIEFKENLIKEKKEFKRGVMQKLLTGEMRFPEFNGKWKQVVIGDIFEEVKRINDNISMGIDILTISAKRGFLSQKDKFSKVIAGSSLDKYTHLHQDEFAYNKGNSKTAPFGCIFKLDMKEGLVPFVYICFRPTQMIDVDFFNFYFKHGLINRQLKEIITSGARGDGLLNVAKDDFFNIKIPSPSIEEQKKIGFVLRLNQNELDYLLTELNQLKEQKRGLVQLLLTGIVRVEVD